MSPPLRPLRLTLVEWVEQGSAADRVIARARGAGSSVGVKRDMASNWSADRCRPLCPYPRVARLKPGAWDLESADSFQFQCE